MSEQGERPPARRQRSEDDWWQRLYDDTAPDTGAPPAPTGDTVDDRFASASGALTRAWWDPPSEAAPASGPSAPDRVDGDVPPDRVDPGDGMAPPDRVEEPPGFPRGAGAAPADRAPGSARVGGAAPPADAGAAPADGTGPGPATGSPPGRAPATEASGADRSAPSDRAPVGGALAPDRAPVGLTAPAQAGGTPAPDRVDTADFTAPAEVGGAPDRAEMPPDRAEEPPGSAPPAGVDPADADLTTQAPLGGPPGHPPDRAPDRAGRAVGPEPGAPRADGPGVADPRAAAVAPPERAQEPPPRPAGPPEVPAEPPWLPPAAPPAGGFRDVPPASRDGELPQRRHYTGPTLPPAPAPEAASPSAPESARAEATPGATEPGATEPGATRPGATGPGATGPDARGPGEPPDRDAAGDPPHLVPRPRGGVVGDGPPTYDPEPTALPATDALELAALVPDTVLDGARYGTYTLRAASVRGDSARFRGEPRRDALLTARFGTGPTALVLVAVASGSRRTEHAHLAAADACRWIGSAVGRSHARLGDDIRAGRRGDLKSGLHRLTDRSFGKLRARAAELGVEPEEYRVGLRCLLLPADPDCRTRVFFGVGPGGLFRLRDGDWQDLEPPDPAPADVTGEPVVGYGSSPPEAGPEGDRLTMDLDIVTPRAPYIEDPVPPPAEPFRFRASVARPGDTLLLCGAGLAEPLRGEPALAGELADRWNGSPAPGMAAFLADTQIRVKGYADDRTAVAVWEA